jgi:hypothetical protein
MLFRCISRQWSEEDRSGAPRMTLLHVSLRKPRLLQGRQTEPGCAAAHPLGAPHPTMLWTRSPQSYAVVLLQSLMRGCMMSLGPSVT